MKAGEKELLRFIEGNDKNFIIPVYQRNYDWGTEQCKQLLSDLKSIDEENLKDYFLGSIVSIDLERGKICIIDGQQRLTTISLLLLAIYHLLDSGEKEAKYFKKEQIKDVYLINKYSDDNDKKIKLKSIKDDAKNFCGLFDNDKLQDNSSRIVANYNFFKKELRKENLDDIFKSIQKLMIVDIELKGEDDPQRIFESLNSTGLALSEADKIRNYILMNEEEKRQEEYYEQYWRGLEENTCFKTSEFIRDFLSYKTRKIPNQKKVYLHFKQFYSDKNIKDKKEDFLKELLRFSKYYNFILTPENFEYREISLLLEDLQTLEVNVFNPALLELFEDVKEGVISKDNLKTILEVIISYVFRRVICDVPTNALNKIFVALINDVKKQKDFSNEKYVDILKYNLSKKKLSAIFPTDEEVKESLLKKDIYPLKTKFYFLGKLENHNNEEKVNVDEMQIEHIMPQKITEDWKKELGEDWREIHNKYLHTLGNLTLTGYNQKMSNLSFKKKKEKGFNDSRLYLNQSLKNLESFGKTELEERLETLTKRVIEVWTYPQSDYKPIGSIKESEGNNYSLEDEEEDFAGKKIVSFNLLKEGEQEAKSWVDFYIKTVKFLLNKDFGYLRKFQEAGIKIVDKRYPSRYLEKFEEEVSKKDKETRYREIMPSIILHKDLSANTVLKNLKIIVEQIGFELGDFEFTILDD